MATHAGRRLLFLCPELDAGGAERHWADLVPGLRDRGLAVRVVALQGGGRALQHLREEGIPVRELGRSGFSSLLTLPQILAEGRARPAVVVTFGYNAHAIGAAAARTLGSSHIVNWHRQQGWTMAAHEAGAVRLAARLGAGAIAVTAAQLPDLAALGFDPVRTWVVPNGARAPAFQGDRASARERLGLPPDGMVAVLAARLRPEKQIGDFLDACAQLGRPPAFQAVVVGDGPMAEDLRRQAAGLQAPVLFAGYQPDPTPWMVAADVVCLTSGREALPMALIEALACGRPCITTDVGGTRDIVEHGRNGLVVEPGNVPALVRALRTIAADPALRDRMGRASFERWRATFSFDVMADSYAALLGSVEGMPVAFDAAA